MLLGRKGLDALPMVKATANVIRGRGGQCRLPLKENGQALFDAGCAARDRRPNHPPAGRARRNGSALLGQVFGSVRAGLRG